MLLCLLNVLLRYNIVSEEENNRKRNCEIGGSSFRITGRVVKMR